MPKPTVEFNDDTTDRSSAADVKDDVRAENKQLFVEALKLAFRAGDDERYEPQIWGVEYAVDGTREYLRDLSRTTEFIDVTGCSCKAIAEAFIENFL